MSKILASKPDLVTPRFLSNQGNIKVTFALAHIWTGQMCFLLKVPTSIHCLQSEAQ